MDPDDINPINTKTFYGRQRQIVAQIRNIPSDSDDSELSEDELHENSAENKEDSDDDDDDCDSEDEIPLSIIQQRESLANIAKIKNVKWEVTRTRTDEVNTVFMGSELLPYDVLQLNSPYKLFSFFLSEDFFDQTARQSCIYSVQQNPNQPLTTSIEELQRFVGILLWTSLVRQPTTRRHWSPHTRFPQIADVMTVNRFERLKKNIHFSNNLESKNKTEKILPVLQEIKQACKRLPMEEKLSCDEQIIPFKGRISLKTYNPKKPHKWGYKMWVLSGVSGMSYNFELFGDKEACVQIDGEPSLGAASDVIVRLCRDIPSNVNHKVYYDNYFSSLPLVAYLDTRKIHTVSTIRQNRLKNFEPRSEKEMKALGRGAILEKSTKVGSTNIRAVQWYDNKVVTLASSYCGTEPVSKVKRFFKSENCKKEVECPDIVRVYNKHMGGVDLQDSLLGLYPIKVKSKKWYHRIFYHMLDVAVVNAWILDKKIKRQLGQEDKIIPLLTFKTELAMQLCNRGLPNTHKRGRPSNEVTLKPKRRCLEPSPSKNIQMDGVGHWPVWTKERERCKLQGCKGKSRVKCSKCKVHLCCNSNKNCFLNYHSNL